MNHKHIVEKPDYERAVNCLKDVQELLQRGFKPEWKNGELLFL